MCLCWRACRVHQGWLIGDSAYWTIYFKSLLCCCQSIHHSLTAATGGTGRPPCPVRKWTHQVAPCNCQLINNVFSSNQKKVQNTFECYWLCSFWFFPQPIVINKLKKEVHLFENPHDWIKYLIYKCKVFHIVILTAVTFLCHPYCTWFFFWCYVPTQRHCILSPFLKFYKLHWL